MNQRFLLFCRHLLFLIIFTLLGLVTWPNQASAQEEQIRYGLVQDPADPLSITAVLYPNFTTMSVTVESALFTVLLPQGTVMDPTIALFPNTPSSIPSLNGTWTAQAVTEQVYTNLNLTIPNLEGRDIYQFVQANLSSNLPYGLTDGQAFELFTFRLPGDCLNTTVELLTNDSTLQQTIDSTLQLNVNNSMMVRLDGAPPIELYQGADSASFSLACPLQPRNQPPAAQGDTFSTVAGIQLAGDVLADNGNGVDSDPENDTLTVTLINSTSITSALSISLTSGALLSMNSDGTFTYDDNGAPSPDTFTYTIDDGNGGTDTGIVTITLTDPCLEPLSDCDGDGVDRQTEGTAGTDPDDADTDDDGLTDGEELYTTRSDPLLLDTDGDGLQDGTELGEGSGHVTDTDPVIFVRDADMTTTTSPLDADSDDDGLTDGMPSGSTTGEDKNNDGQVDFVETDPNHPDSDSDGLQDGTERGEATGHPTDTDKSVFIPDADPNTTTDPLDPDTDDGGYCDGSLAVLPICVAGEDANNNGLQDGEETDPTTGNGDDDIPNSAPKANDDLPTAVYETAININVRANDVDGEDPSGRPQGSLRIVIPPLDTQGSATLNNNNTPALVSDDTIDFSPADGFQGDSSFRYEICDSEGLCDTASVTVVVNPPNNTVPVAANDTANTGEEIAIFIDVRANDIDQEDTSGRPEGSLSIGTPPLIPEGEASVYDNGTPTDPSDDTIHFTPAIGFVGNSSFSYQICDKDGLCTSAQVVVTVNPPADSDGDGLTDDEEIDGFDQIPNSGDETDPNDADTDDDGLLDGNEVYGPDSDPTTNDGTDPNSADSDADGVQDGTEYGLATPQLSSHQDHLADTNSNFFMADEDPASTTDPLDVDSDDDGLADGGVNGEDADGDGRIDPNETDPNNSDTDGDGIKDGTEMGVTQPLIDSIEEGQIAGTDSSTTDFLPDTDPTTTTDPLDADSDDDGLPDGGPNGEDQNGNGAQDSGDSKETDPNNPDTDGDGINDGTERGVIQPVPDPDGDGSAVGTEATSPNFVPDVDTTTTTDPLDVDSDDDGLADGGPAGEDTNGNGVLNANESDATKPDTDGDGIYDGTEKGVTTPVADPDGTDLLLGTDPDSPNYVPDLDPTTRTDPLDADTDDDGLADGSPADGRSGEDQNNDGRVDAGETMPNQADSDEDGIQDGTELGITMPLADPDGAGPALGSDPVRFIPDSAPAATTNPLDADSDDDGYCDGSQSVAGICEQGGEDANNNGSVDSDESDPLDTCDPTRTLAGCPDADSDNDGLTNQQEKDGPDGIPGTGDETDPLDGDTDNDGINDGAELSGLDNVANTGDESDPLDADSDDDGLSDGSEWNGADGQPDTGDETDPLLSDTDGDGVQDGTEKGITLLIVGGSSDGDGIVFSGTDPNHFTPDTDSSTTTDPLDADSDDDGLMDGTAAGEDKNGNGLVELTETDPGIPDTDQDGLMDGTERGILLPVADPDGEGPAVGTDSESPHFVPDGDPTTGTDPLNADSDGDGFCDGSLAVVDTCALGQEDLDDNGQVDEPNESDPLNRCDPDNSAPVCQSPDTDDDGLTDAEEAILATDPNDVDTDNDGLTDGQEVGPDGIYIFTADSGSEPRADTNPLDADADDDGISDGEEIEGPDGDPNTPDGTDPLNPDTDQDGIPDGVERGRTIPIQGGISDNDGIPFTGTDLARFVPDADPATTTEALDADTDDDGYCDGNQNVVGVCTNGGEDQNANGVVDEPNESDPLDPCDPDTLRTICGGNNNDNDGLTNDEELNGPDGTPGTGDETDPDDPDTDNDGLSDGEERNGPDGDPNTPDGTDPLDADTDDDGLSDGEEWNGPDGDPSTSDGTDWLNPDTDGDGIQDGTEIGRTTIITDGVSDINSIPFVGTNAARFVADAAPDTSTDPLDLDTDDDGVTDGGSMGEDKNNDGAVDSTETDPNKMDTDQDGLPDGTELGVTQAFADPDGSGPVQSTNTERFVPDADPTTTTDPLNPDTDEDGYCDGSNTVSGICESGGEDLNNGGQYDEASESDPLDACSPNPTFGDCSSDDLIRGVVWQDANGDGIRQSGESLIGNVVVRLFEGRSPSRNLASIQQTPVQTTTTDADGSYVFNGMGQGSHYVEFVAPDLFVPSQANQGSDEGIDSDGQRVTGELLARTDNIIISNVGNIFVRDQGITTPATLISVIFNDTNSNGTRDAGESLVPSAIVALYDQNGNKIAETPPDNVGNFRFEDLTPGRYSFDIQVPGGFLTPISGRQQLDVLGPADVAVQEIALVEPSEPTPPKVVTLIRFTALREPDSILLEWETSSEVGTYGFHLYRIVDPRTTVPNGLIENQERIRVTNKYILGQGPDGGLYQVRDYNIEKGVEYVYYLEETELDGKINAVDHVSTSPQSGTSLFLPIIMP
ncbi:MAG: SdrD B-like domain-containing protein [Chloroflexota bacterium]